MVVSHLVEKELKTIFIFAQLVFTKILKKNKKYDFELNFLMKKKEAFLVPPFLECISKKLLMKIKTDVILE